MTPLSLRRFPVLLRLRQQSLRTQSSQALYCSGPDSLNCSVVECYNELRWEGLRWGMRQDSHGRAVDVELWVGPAKVSHLDVVRLN